MEIWKDIIGYEKIYQISNLGNVKGLSRSIMRSNGRKQTFKEKMVKPYPNSTGRLRVGLSRDGNWEKIFIHRLVGIHFIPNLLNKPQINHMDGDYTNNNISNLEWVTQEENVQHAYKNGLMGYKLSVEDERIIISNYKTNKQTFSEISREYNVSRYTIRRIINGTRKIKRV